MSREGDGFFDGAFFQREEAKDENGWSMVCTTKFLCSTQKAEPDDSPGSQRADDESVALTDADGFEVDIVEVAQARKEAPARDARTSDGGVLGDYGLGAYGGYPRRSKAGTRTRRVSSGLLAVPCVLIVVLLGLLLWLLLPRVDLFAKHDDDAAAPAFPTVAPTVAFVTIEVAWTAADDLGCDGVANGGGERLAEAFVAAALAVDPASVSNMTCDDAAPGGRRLEDACAAEVYGVVVSVEDLAETYGITARPDAASDAAAVAVADGDSGQPVGGARLRADAAADAASLIRADAPTNSGAVALADGDPWKPFGSSRVFSNTEADAATVVRADAATDSGAVPGADGDSGQSIRSSRLCTDAATDAATVVRADAATDSGAVAGADGDSGQSIRSACVRADAAAAPRPVARFFSDAAANTASELGSRAWTDATAIARADRDTWKSISSSRVRSDPEANAASELGSGAWTDASAVASADGYARESDSSTYFRSDSEANAASKLGSSARADTKALASTDGHSREPLSGTCFCSDSEANAAAVVRPRTRTDAAAISSAHGDARKPISSSRVRSDAEAYAAAVMDDVVPKLTGSKSRTLGAWLRIDAYDGAYILMIGGGDNNCQHFGLRAGFEEEALEVAFKGTCSATVNKTNVTAGEWHHVAIVYEESVDWRLHVDGEVVAAGAAVLDTPDE
ncbi:hypothetical protein JL722_12662 [Aureococcus anophagefferens]|nr:hypothetical protein JL722_12662 [Aureococcus anophagefferens]